jgi:hypothetical protein
LLLHFLTANYTNDTDGFNPISEIRAIGDLTQAVLVELFTVFAGHDSFC